MVNINKKIFQFHNSYYYSDEYGNIYNKVGKLLCITYDKDGYSEVQLSGNIKNKNGNIVRYKVKIHTIVAKLFVYKPNSNENLEVNHKDLNRKNNYYKNLEWITHKENINYSYQKGSYNNICKGEQNPNSKLTKNDVLFIRKLYSKGINIRKIYQQYYFNKVSESSIENICKYKTWKDK